MKEEHWHEFVKEVAIQTFMQDVRLSYLAKCVMAASLLEPLMNIYELVCDSTDYAESEIMEAITQLHRLGYLELLQSIAEI